MKPMSPSRWAWGATALIALGLVFLSYLQPDLVVQLANQVWSCF
jgi:hypothetical protein